MKQIPLSKGLFALVDDEDFAELDGFRWCATGAKKPGGTRFYARRNGVMTNYKAAPPVYMHRVIAGAAKGQIVDHINGNSLDNRRANLRIVTHSQNNMNRVACSGTSLKGVYPQGRKFSSRICVNGRDQYLGVFSTTEEAARAYDEAAAQHFGEFARLNSLTSFARTGQEPATS